MLATPSHSCLTRAAGDRAHLAPLVNQRRLRLEVAGAAALLVFFGRPTPSATRYTRLFLRKLRDIDYRTKIFSCSTYGADGALALEASCKDTGMEDYRLDQRVDELPGRKIDGRR